MSSLLHVEDLLNRDFSDSDSPEIDSKLRKCESTSLITFTSQEVSPCKPMFLVLEDSSALISLLRFGKWILGFM